MLLLPDLSFYDSRCISRASPSSFFYIDAGALKRIRRNKAVYWQATGLALTTDTDLETTYLAVRVEHDRMLTVVGRGAGSD